MRSYVDLRLGPKQNEWRKTIEGLCTEDDSQEGQRMWIYDVKRHPSVNAVDGPLCQQPWKRTPTLKATDFRFVCYGLPLC